MVEKIKKVVDTIEDALNNPNKEQPFAELGLKEDEYLKIKEILGRRPTDAELAMYSVMWSEHCSYKSSKIHLKKFGQKMNEKMKENLLVGMGENAGVVDIGNGMAVTFKAESHNHPSFVEPFQGAATGVGGIVRDIIAMGARPIAVMDQLRFGDITHEDSKRVIPGVVAGISHYGNCLGLPNIGGDTEFDSSFQGNPLVNALCLGVLKHEEIHTSAASGNGAKIILFGARTGGDGIGGASILASESFSEEGESKRPSVQVGDPFMEKILIECCRELFEKDAVDGIQDLGAAGISCATSEMASGGDGGMHIDLDTVLLRDPTLNPGEILMSESQERMMAAVPVDKLNLFIEVVQKWDVEYSIIGQVNDSGRLTIDCQGERIVDIDPKTAAVDSPVYERPFAKPDWQDELNSKNVAGLVDTQINSDQLKGEILQVLANPNNASKSWITSQYDRFVLGNTRFAMPSKAGVIRVGEKTGVVLATDGNCKYMKLNPQNGAKRALVDAYLNVACTGAKPLAITDCLNFGNPERPENMWQLVEAIDGLSDACLELEIPVTGGNVSLYNTTGEDESINPVVNIGLLGKIDDIEKVISSYFIKPNTDNLAVILLEPNNSDDSENIQYLNGSSWADSIKSHFGGNIPDINLEDTKNIGHALNKLVDQKLLKSATKISNGGLIITLLKAALIDSVGLNFEDISLLDQTSLFMEKPNRIILSCHMENVDSIQKIANDFNLKTQKIASLTNDKIVKCDKFEFTFEELNQVFNNIKFN